MKPLIIIKTVKNFLCPKIDAEVRLEYCTDFRYDADKDNGAGAGAGELLIYPDCEEKDRCGIASQQNGKTTYDWSHCANPELRTAVRQTAREVLTSGQI